MPVSHNPKEDAPTHYIAKYPVVPIHPSALIGTTLDQGPSVLVTPKANIQANHSEGP